MRNVIDIYEHCETNNIGGAIISIDFKKALEHNFLYKVLEKFNFGNDFITWVQMAYTSPQFRVKNNGWISGKHKMERGIRI